jgi:Prokaryotic phospholipase A2
MATAVTICCLAAASGAAAQELTTTDATVLAEPVTTQPVTTEPVTTELLATDTLTEEAEPQAKPEPDKNGCGPGWVSQPFDGAADNPGGFAFKDFCDKHDVCYGTKPAEGVKPEDHKKACDDEFRKGMLDYCEKVEGAKITTIWKITWPDKSKPPVWEKVDIKWNDDAARKHCKFWAETYYKLVTGPLGQKAFDAAQAKAKEGEEGLLDVSYVEAIFAEPVATAPTYDATYELAPTGTP